MHVEAVQWKAMRPEPRSASYAPLLASVSRTFYLSIRLLPGQVRGPVALAYLLARASDTIADSDAVPAEVRLRHLARFAEAIALGETQHLAEIPRAISSSHPGERELLCELAPCIAWLQALPEFDRGAIRAVEEQIIRGQTLDLERFAGAGKVLALPDAAALEEYTYLVAGCVGEFWSDVCAHYLPAYSARPLAELRGLGREFGQGLQLVNILRDLPADLMAGRCYLPADELHAAGGDPRALTSDTARPVFARWLSRADALLESGRRYITAIRPARVRAGCFLPWQLGVKTLRLLEKHPPLESTQRVKVSRAVVRRAVLLSAVAAFSDGPLAAQRRVLSA